MLEKILKYSRKYSKRIRALQFKAIPEPLWARPYARRWGLGLTERGTHTKGHTQGSDRNSSWGPRAESDQPKLSPAKGKGLNKGCYH